MNRLQDCFFTCRDTYAFSFHLLRIRRRSLLLWIALDIALSLLLSLLTLAAVLPALFFETPPVWLGYVGAPLVLTLALVLLLGKMRLAVCVFIKGERFRSARFFEPFRWPAAYPKCLLLVFVALLLELLIFAAFFFIMTEVNSFVQFLYSILFYCTLSMLVLSAAVRLVGTKARCRVRDMLRPQQSVYVPLLFASAGLLLLCLPVHLVTLLAGKLLPPLVVSWLVRFPLSSALEAWFLATVCLLLKDVVNPPPLTPGDIPQDAPRDTMEPMSGAQEEIDSYYAARRNFF